MNVYIHAPKHFQDFPGLAHRVERAAARGIRWGLVYSVPIVRRYTRDAPPASARGLVGAVASKRYLNDWRAGPLPFAGIGGVLVNAVPHAAEVEAGTPAGRPPPKTSNLVLWLGWRFGASSTNPNTWVKARRIAVRISRRGLRARRVMNDAVDDVTERVVENVVRRIDFVLRTK